MPVVNKFCWAIIAALVALIGVNNFKIAGETGSMLIALAVAILGVANIILAIWIVYRLITKK